MSKRARWPLRTLAIISGATLASCLCCSFVVGIFTSGTATTQSTSPLSTDTPTAQMPSETYTPAQNPTSSPTLTLTPASSPTDSIQPPATSLNTTPPAISPTTIFTLTLPQEVASSEGWLFTINRIDLLEAIDTSSRQHRPENGVFLVMIGVISNLTGGDECIKGQSFTLRDGVKEYEMSRTIVDAAKDIYELDYPGFFRGQCLDRDTIADSYLVFDVSKESNDLWLKLQDTEMQIGPITPLLTATPIVVATSTPVPTFTTEPTIKPTVVVTSIPVSTKTPKPTISPTFTIAPTLAQPTETVPIPTIALPTNTQPPETVPIPTIALPTNTQPPAPAFTLLTITSPVQVGGNATVEIQTTPGVSCHLRYITPIGNESEAEGLGYTTADANGICSWTWKIGSSTKPGTGSVVIRVNEFTQSFDIEIIE